jgi:HIT zinc finger
MVVRHLILLLNRQGSRDIFWNLSRITIMPFKSTFPNQRVLSLRIPIRVGNPVSLYPPIPISSKLCPCGVSGVTIAPRKQHKTTPNVRKLLATRKTLTNLLDEAGFAADVYRDAGVKQGRYPSRTFCSVCGYWGKYGCMKCGERYCDEKCAETHRGNIFSLSFL